MAKYRIQWDARVKCEKTFDTDWFAEHDFDPEDGEAFIELLLKKEVLEEFSGECIYDLADADVWNFERETEVSA